MAPRIRATVDELLGAVDPSVPFDLVGALYFPLPATMIFSFMGVTNPPSDYTQGHTLTDAVGPPFAVSASWDSAALVTDKATVVFGTETTNASFEVFDADYRPAPAALGPDRATLLALMKRMREFSR